VTSAFLGAGRRRVVEVAACQAYHVAAARVAAQPVETLAIATVRTLYALTVYGNFKRHNRFINLGYFLSQRGSQGIL
jgi:hypothetical protein